MAKENSISLSVEQLIENLSTDCQESVEEEAYVQSVPESIRQSFTPDSKKFIESIKNLEKEKFDLYTKEVEELCRKYYSWPAEQRLQFKHQLVTKFIDINKKFGIAIPPVLLLLLNIGSFIFNLLRFILVLRKKRERQTVFAEEVEEHFEDNTFDTAKEQVVFENWFLDKFKNLFKSKILPVIIDGAIEFLQEKRELILEVLVYSIKSGLEKALDNLKDLLSKNKNEFLS